jgi:hypothetical protein
VQVNNHICLNLCNIFHRWVSLAPSLSPDLLPTAMSRLTRCQSYKSFSLSLKLAIFVLGKPFQLGLMFAGKAGANVKKFYNRNYDFS